MGNSKSIGLLLLSETSFSEKSLCLTKREVLLSTKTSLSLLLFLSIDRAFDFHIIGYLTSKKASKDRIVTNDGTNHSNSDPSGIFYQVVSNFSDFL